MRGHDERSHVKRGYFGTLSVLKSRALNNIYGFLNHISKSELDLELKSRVLVPT